MDLEPVVSLRSTTGYKLVRLRRTPKSNRLRRVRHEISAEIEHDPKRLLEHYRKLEAEYEDRLVHAEEGAPR